MHDTRQTLIDRYVAAYNAFDVDGMLAVLAPQVRFEHHTGGQLTASAEGRDAFRRLAQQAVALFAEREQRVTRLQWGPETATADIAYRGCLARDIPGGPPAGTRIELQGTTEFAFEDGLISRIVDRS